MKRWAQHAAKGNYLEGLGQAFAGKAGAELNDVSVVLFVVFFVCSLLDEQYSLKV